MTSSPLWSTRSRPPPSSPRLHHPRSQARPRPAARPRVRPVWAGSGPAPDRVPWFQNRIGPGIFLNKRPFKSLVLICYLPPLTQSFSQFIFVIVLNRNVTIFITPLYCNNQCQKFGKQ